jgi:hypothetical protein
MRRFLTASAIAGLAASSVLAGTASAAGGTYTINCGSGDVTVTKPNDNAAIYTNGSTIYVTAIGTFKSDGAQPGAVTCNLSGDEFGPIPVPFLIVR